MAKEVTLDDMRPPEEITHEKDKQHNIIKETSLEQQNKNNRWAVVHLHVVEEDGVEKNYHVEYLEPTFEEVAEDDIDEEDVFEYWQDCAEYIRSEYEQPDEPDEVIAPYPLYQVKMEVFDITHDIGEGPTIYVGALPDEYQ